MTFVLNPRQEHEFRENSAKKQISAGWKCVRCHRRTTVMVGRKVSLAPKGWICVACQK